MKSEANTSISVEIPLQGPSIYLLGPWILSSVPASWLLRPKSENVEPQVGGIFIGFL